MGKKMPRKKKKIHGKIICMSEFMENCFWISFHIICILDFVAFVYMGVLFVLKFDSELLSLSFRHTVVVEFQQQRIDCCIPAYMCIFTLWLLYAVGCQRQQCKNFDGRHSSKNVNKSKSELKGTYVVCLPRWFDCHLVEACAFSIFFFFIFHSVCVVHFYELWNFFLNQKGLTR